jgi:hypothetical protein
VRSDVARISDVENGMLNLERQFERLLRQFAKKYPDGFRAMDLNVFSFALFLFEMAMASPMNNLSDLDRYSQSASREVLTVLLFLDNYFSFYCNFDFFFGFQYKF